MSFEILSATSACVCRGLLAPPGGCAGLVAGGPQTHGAASADGSRNLQPVDVMLVVVCVRLTER